MQLISGPLRFSAPVPSADGKKLFVVGREVRVELLRYDARAKRFDICMAYPLVRLTFPQTASGLRMCPIRKWTYGGAVPMEARRCS